MIGLTNNLAFSLFVPKEGMGLALYIIGSILFGVIFLFALTKVPSRYRKPLVITVTFVAGLFYFFEFFIPANSETKPIRQKLATAEQQLRMVEQDLTGVSLDSAGRIESGKSNMARVDSARDRLDKTLKSLDAAQRLIDAKLVVVRIRLENEAKEADRFAKAHNLKPSMLKREPQSDDPGAPIMIVDARTGATKKRLGDITDSGRLVGRIKAGVMGIQQALDANPVTGVRELAVGANDLARGVQAARGAVSKNFLTPYKEPVGQVSGVIQTFAALIGVISLWSIHGKAVAKRRPGWHNSLGFCIAFSLMALCGFTMKYAHTGSSLQKLGDTGYTILFNGGYSALQATMFSLVAFYIASAAYRAFRVKSGETVLMMGAAFLVMLSIVPIGIWLTHWSWIPDWLRLANVGDWIMTVPNMAAQRGMAFGISVGGLAMALRMWLSLERGSYFDKQM